MGISIYYLKKLKISTTICDSLSHSGLELIDLFSSKNKLFQAITIGKRQKIYNAIETELKTIFKNINIFDEIVMLASVGSNLDSGKINTLINSINEFNHNYDNLDWENLGFSSAAEKLKQYTLKYTELLKEETIQHEIQRWKCFNYFLKNILLLDDDIDLLGYPKDTFYELTQKHLIVRNKQDNGYLLNIDSLNFKDQFTDLFHFNITVYKNNRSPNDNNMTKDYISFEEFLKSDVRHIETLTSKINGLTLQEIGDIQGVSRERVRQKINNVLKKIPEIKEVDLYKHYFTSLDISKEDFINIYYHDGRLFELLDLLYDKGTESIIDEVITGDYSDEIKSYISNKYSINFYNGELQKISNHQFLENILKNDTNGTIYYKIPELYEIVKNEIVHFPQLNIKDLRSLETILKRCSNIVYSNGLGYRYFSFNIDQSIKAKINHIFTSLKDGAYSCDFILSNHPEISEQFGILTGSELHYLCRKKIFDVPVQLGRNPEFVKGNHTKSYYILNNMLTENYDTIDDFSALMNRHYGLNEASLKSYLFLEFKENCHNGKIYFETDHHKEIINEIQHHFTENLYTEKVFFDLLNQFVDKNIITEALLYNLGYIHTREFVYSKKFRTSTEALELEILSSDIFDFSDKNFPITPSAYALLHDLEKNFKILKSREARYTNTRFLEKKGISINHLKQFIKDVETSTEKDIYFSLHSLIQSGIFIPPLDEESDLYLFDRAISLSSQIKKVNNVYPHIYIKTTKKITMSIFLKDMIQITGPIKLEDFIRFIQQKFGITFKQDKLKERLSNSKLIYDKLTTKIYTH